MRSSGVVMTPANVAMIGGSIGIVVGTLLPWISINLFGSTLSFNVLDFAKSNSVGQLTANPVFALVAGVVAAVAAIAYLMMASAPWATWVVAIAALAALTVAGLLVFDLERSSTQGIDLLSLLGTGYWISVVGAIVAIAAAVMTLRSRPAAISSQSGL